MPLGMANAIIPNGLRSALQLFWFLNNPPRSFMIKKLSLIVLLNFILSSCANLSSIGSDYSRYKNDVPNTLQQSKPFEGVKVHLTTFHPEIYDHLDVFKRQEGLKRGRQKGLFLEGHLTNKIKALGGTITSKDKADILVSAFYAIEEEKMNGVRIWNVTLSLITGFIIPIPFKNTMHFTVHVTENSNNEDSEKYVTKDTYRQTMGGLLTLFTEFGASNAAAALNNSTNEFLINLDDDGLLEEFIGSPGQ